MNWILDALHDVQTAFSSSTPSAPGVSREPVLPELTKLNDSVYELRKASESRIGRPSVEIVFCHGLQFDGFERTYLTTWLSRDGQESWLPWIFECYPKARVLLVSYSGSVKKEDDQGCTDMYITSENLWQDLIADSAQVGQDGCPVVLVGHSLGGLVIKEVLLKVYSMLKFNPTGMDNEKLRTFLENVKHLFYYSCPHHGTRLADISTQFSKGPLFHHLTTLNKEAARCNEEFRKLCDEFKWTVYSIGENLPTNMGQLGKHIVVAEASARHATDNFYTVVDADHVNVCRPESTKHASFSKLMDVIEQALASDVNGHKVTFSRDKVVGLDHQVQRVRRELEISRQLALFGPGGMGKTTLAKLVYNDISDYFEYTCFVSEVKGIVAENASLKDLQAEILKNLYYKGRKVEGSFQWSRLEGKEVLVVLDDVKYESQVLDLSESGFSTESCVLLTCRDKNIPRLRDFKVHSVEVLDYEASKTLFCNHAFKSVKAPEAYKDDVERFVQKCGGWPLVLEVTGKYLYKREQGAVWDAAFNKLSEAKPLSGKEDDKLKSLFRTIYDSLATEERLMFLDVAICFHNENLEFLKEVWRAYISESAEAGLQNLLDMGLVTITSNSRVPYSRGIHMHEVLRDFGRSIPGQGRVCHDKYDGPWPFQQGNSDVEILKITKASRAIDIRNLLGLANLKVLWLDCVVVLGYEQFGQLRALKSLTIIPKVPILIPRRLSALRNLTTGHYIGDTIPDSPGQLSALRNLTISDYMGDSIPDSVGQISALETLIVANCYNLIHLPSTLGQLKALRRLEVVGCVKLTALPGTVGELRGLRLLRIVLCLRLESLPDALRKCQALDHLEISGCPRLNALPLTTMEFPALRHFEIQWDTGSGRDWELLQGMLRKFRPLQLQHLTVCIQQNLEIVKERLQELDALKHLEARIHDDERTYRKGGGRELGKKRNSLEIVDFLTSSTLDGWLHIYYIVSNQSYRTSMVWDL